MRKQTYTQNKTYVLVIVLFVLLRHTASDYPFSRDFSITLPYTCSEF